MRTLLLVLALVLLVGGPAHAHGMRTAYVEISEAAPGSALVRVNACDPRMGAVTPVFGEGCQLVAQSSHGAERSFTLRCEGSLAGREVRVEGLGPVAVDAVIWIAFAGGDSYSHVLTADAPSWRLPAAESSLGIARQYARLGVEHIASGVDHLLFLLAIVLSMQRWRAVILAETAFTLSHTLTFSASALGWISVSPVAAEACIALSLVLIALECARRREGPVQLARGHVRSTVLQGPVQLARGHVRSTVLQGPVQLARGHVRSTVLQGASGVARGAGLAFAFGLVHGLGFAGGLAEVGLPARGIPLALAGFAAGVELGQVAFLAAVFLAWTAAAHLRARRVLALAGAYSVGAAGVFLLLHRVVEIYDQTLALRSP